MASLRHGGKTPRTLTHPPAVEGVSRSAGASPSGRGRFEMLQAAGTQRTPSAVLFSPYNMVKLIPSKEHSEMFGQYREPSAADWDCEEEDDDDDDDDEEDKEDEE